MVFMVTPQSLDRRGFALPAVLITSVVMLIVLLATLQGVVSISQSLTGIHYDRLAREAAESGIRLATDCVTKSTSVWTSAKPLRTGGDCSGLTSPCTSNACYVVKSGNIRTSFEVSEPVVDGKLVRFTSTGIVEITRTSNPNVVSRTFKQTVKYVGEDIKFLQWRQSLVAGVDGSCAIASDNKAYCWGSDASGQLGTLSVSGSSTKPVAIDQGAMPAGATIRELATGYSNNCAVASDNKAYCWGNNGYGQLGIGTSGGTAGTPSAVVQGAMPAGATIRQISAGWQATCAIASDNKAYCWGYNAYYGLGNGTNTNSSSPVAVSQGSIPAGLTIRQIAARDNHSCAIASDNKAYCWGLGANGRLGGGVATDRPTPYPVSQGAMPTGAMVRQIIVGGNISCAIASDNKAYCWGQGTDGRLGNGATADALSPVAVSQGAMPADRIVQQITAGSDHTCAIASNSKAYCWGLNSSGQLGNGTTTSSSAPVEVSMPGGAKVQRISAGHTHTCATTTDSLTYCWGSNVSGRLGDGTTTDSNVPVRTTSITNVAAYPDIDMSVTLASQHTCALGEDSWAYCWGYNSFASRQLGTGGGSGNFATPVKVAQGAIPLGVTLNKISSDGTHTCAIGSDGWAYCWGGNNTGQLGDNTTITRATPIAIQRGAIPAGATILDIEAGWTRTCAVASDGRAYCWGSALEGRLGNGVTTNTIYPTPVAVSQGAMPADRIVKQIAAADNNTCVIASNNRAYCWGGGGFGANGNGSTADAPTPVAVTLPSGVTSFYKISTAGSSACALANNNRVYCWGFASTGILGNGSTTDTTAPTTPVTLPSGVTSFQDVSIRGNFACAIGNNNRIYCWGYNDSTGRLGNGSTTAAVVTSPVAVTLPSGVTSFYSVELGSDYACALANNNRVYCWGDSSNGKLGNGATSGTYATPVPISQAPDYTSSAGIHYIY